MKILPCLIFFTCLQAAIVNGQVCFNEHFDSDTNIVYSPTPSTLKWRVVDLFNADSGHISVTWDNDGRADRGNFWDNRQSIQSPSGGGAFIFNPDDSFFVNPQKGNFLLNSSLFSPKIGLPVGGLTEPIYLNFYQYYRAYSISNANVYICTTGDCDETSEEWVQIFSNYPVGSGYETPNAQQITINLSKYLYNPASNTWADFLRIRFEFIGQHYFWIIDDVSVCQQGFGAPTNPPDLKGLLEPEHPYRVDDEGNPYRPDELVAEFKPETSDTERAEIRASLGVDTFTRCSCNLNLELWKFNINRDPQLDALSAKGDTTTRIQEVIKSSKPKTGLLGDDVIYNYYTHSSASKKSGFPYDGSGLAPIPNTPNGIPPSENGEIILAHLDTGLDFTNPELAKHIWRNDSNPPYLGDLIGHNFVDNNNNVLDVKNNHGNRTALMITNQLPFLNCPYKIMILKTHDQDGFGTLFNNTCALYYALQHRVAVVTTAFAWSGAPNNIMVRAIDHLANMNIHMTTASGNYGVPLDSNGIFPSVYNRPNQTNVASIAADSTLSYFSNYSPSLVHMAAKGEDLEFDAFPGAIYQGTSYAAPQVASAIAALKCLYGEDVPTTLHRLFECAYKKPSLEYAVKGGYVLNYEFPCFYPDSILGRKIYAVTHNNLLISFDSKAPSIIRSVTPIRGITGSQKLEAIDFRTLTGELFGLAYDQSNGQARIFSIDLRSGTANPIGTTNLQLAPNMGSIGFDMNPATDQWRISGSNGVNYRVNPIDGILIATDPPITFNPGDSNAGKQTKFGTLAHTNNFDGAGSAELFAIDENLDILAHASNLNSGLFETVGPTELSLNSDGLGIDLDLVFDPITRKDYGFLSAQIRGSDYSSFYEIDLNTGTAALIGPIGGKLNVKDIAIYLKEPQTVCESKTVGCIRYEVLRISENDRKEHVFKIRVTNTCSTPMEYTAFGLYKGVTAVSPAQNGLFSSASGHLYETRNPSFSPFYSVRFKDLGQGIHNGQSELFEYVLPPYVQQQYILTRTSLGNNEYYETYLSVQGCTDTPEDRRQMQEMEQMGAIVSPNPSNGRFEVRFSEPVTAPLQLRLYSMLGTEVWSKTISQNLSVLEVELPADWNNGVYFLEIYQQNKYLAPLRLVVQK